MIVNNNTPSVGYISWSDVGISYKGQVYNVADGNTNLTYIYWKYSDPLNFYGSNVFPTLGPDDLLVFLNKNGTYVVVPNATVVDGSLIVPESILANAISANAITAEKILAGAISSSKIAADAIESIHISAGAITASKIAADAITADKIAANAIGAGAIASGVIIADNIAAGAIGVNALAANSVTSAKIAAGAVTASKLQVNSRNMLWDIDTFQQFPEGVIVGGTQLSSTTSITSETDAMFGSKVLKHVSSGVNSTKYIGPIGVVVSTQGSAKLVPGKRYILSTYVKTTSATPTNVTIEAIPKEGTGTTSVTGSNAATLSISASAGYRRISVLTPVIGGTAPRMAIRISNASSGVTTYWDGFMLEEYDGTDTSPSPFTPGGMAVIDGGNITANSITATQLAVGAVTASNIAAGAITSDKINAGTIEGIDIIGSRFLSDVETTEYKWDLEADAGRLTFLRTTKATNTTSAYSELMADILYMNSPTAAVTLDIDIARFGQDPMQLRRNIAGSLGVISLSPEGFRAVSGTNVLDQYTTLTGSQSGVELSAGLNGHAYVIASGASGVATTINLVASETFVDGDLAVMGDILGDIPNEDYNLMSLSSGWSHFSTSSGPWERGQYWKDRNGVVHLAGLIKGGTTTNGTVLTTLPVGYRPAMNLVFIVTTITGTARIDVYPNGQVVGQRDLHATWTSLAGISFKAA